MSSDRNVQLAIRQYLLGQMAGEALELFEEQLFADDSLFEEVLIAEDELVDESLAHELNETEVELFAKNFLNSPERKQKLLFRRVLKGYVERKMPPKVVPKRWAFLPDIVYSYRIAIASAALIVITASIVLVPLITRGPATFETLNLSMGSNDRAPGAQIPNVKLPLRVDELRLHLELSEPATTGETYRVELVTGSGEKRMLETITQDDKSVVVAISASQLEPGQYALNLYASKPGQAQRRITGSYFFSAE